MAAASSVEELHSGYRSPVCLLNPSAKGSLPDEQRDCGFGRQHVPAMTTGECRSINALAAIYAENGDYESAVRCAERALALAPVAGKQSIEESLVLYRRGQPRREGALDTAEPASGD